MLLGALGCVSPAEPGESSLEISDAEYVDAMFALQAECDSRILRSGFPEALADKIVGSLRLDIEPPYIERAMLSVRLAPDGLVDSLELKSVSSGLIEAPFMELVAMPPVLPRAGQSIRECLGTEPFPLIVAVVRRFDCRAQEFYADYHDDVQIRLYRQLYAAERSGRPGHGWILADLHIGPRGEIDRVTYRRPPSRKLREKFEGALEAVGVFDPPPDYLRCFVDEPLPVRIQVQGSEGAD